jgi:16S rRNA processing protein RimM
LTDLLVAGRVGRPHGLDGSFHVADPVDGLLPVGAAVLVGEERTRVVARKGTAARPILRVALAADRDAAAGLGGRALRVAREEAPPLGDDEYWAADLEGCAVVAGARELGTVEALLGYPSCELLRLGDGTLIPMVGDAIVAVDLEARRIEVDAAFLGLG